VVRTVEQEESAELHIARDALDEKHGSFVNNLLGAFLDSEGENFEMLRPVMRKLFLKEHITCNCVKKVELTAGPHWPVKNKAELMAELDLIARAHLDWTTRVVATALAYAVNDLCPDDRTTKHVFQVEMK